MATSTVDDDWTVVEEECTNLLNLPGAGNTVSGSCGRLKEIRTLIVQPEKLTVQSQPAGKGCGGGSEHFSHLESIRTRIAGPIFQPSTRNLDRRSDNEPGRSGSDPCTPTLPSNTGPHRKGDVKNVDGDKSRKGALCGKQTQRHAMPKALDPEDMAGRHDRRKVVTGSVCIQVIYPDASWATDDISVLREMDDGRVFMERMRHGGIAFRAGVRWGDELVATQFFGRERSPTCGAAKTLEMLKDCTLCPATLYFMGFAGKYPAEVRVASRDEHRFQSTKTIECVVASHSPFELKDEVVFCRDAGLFLTVGPCLSDVVQVDVDALLDDDEPFERSDGTCDETPIRPLIMLEVEPVVAKRLLSKVRADLARHGFDCPRRERPRSRVQTSRSWSIEGSDADQNARQIVDTCLGNSQAANVNVGMISCPISSPCTDGSAEKLTQVADSLPAELKINSAFSRESGTSTIKSGWQHQLAHRAR